VTVPVTREHVFDVIAPDEPDYLTASWLGPDALPHLRYFVETGSPGLAARATYLAGLIDHPNAAPVIEAAANSRTPHVRAAAALGARNLSHGLADTVLLKLLDDDHRAVRTAALKAVPEQPGRALLAKLRAVLASDAEPAIQQLSGRVLERLA
jgi:HEAT repeat protein